MSLRTVRISWKLDVPEGISDTARERIADLVREGYTDGIMDDDQEDN